MNLHVKEKLMPQEETLEVTKSARKLVIGLPLESLFQENRISLIPDAVKTLVKAGHEVILQHNAGLAARFSDREYAESGAMITENAREVFQADVILKVAPLSDVEIEYLKGRQFLLSALHLNTQTKDYFQKLTQKKMSAIAFEYIKDKTNAFPVVRSISEIAGTASIQIAAEYLAHPEFGNGQMLGGFTGIAPSKVVIIGAGTVGEYAARMAYGMGASVKVFDNNVYKLRKLKSEVNQGMFTSTIQTAELQKALASADVLICAVHSTHHRSPVLVTEEMVMTMKEGSVIVDVSIDQGGCVETSKITNHQNPVFRLHGVTHYCVPNIASRVPTTASMALSNFFAPMLIRAGHLGGIDKLLSMDYYFRQGVYVYNGILSNKIIGEYFGLPFQDIDLLMAALH
ncbi:MAG TPA: alanine dehydrogenase [Bacteroidales bacterium]|nr:alanine dehydrogenase [Bacteroidales bacterium]HPR57371.1 alanine dehydrogenase [Bacteroidales bacterium]HRW97180.1 alanine dehydrogenase [Bacteroidales bacterium]